MDWQFLLTLYNGYDYLSMLGLKLIHVGKKGPMLHMYIQQWTMSPLLQLVAYQLPDTLSFWGRETLETHFSGIWVKVQIKSFKKMHLNVPSVKHGPFFTPQYFNPSCISSKIPFALPGHQQQSYWLFRKNGPLPSTRTYFKQLCHHSAEKW